MGSAFSGNRASLGGAVYNLLSELAVIDSSFVNNSAGAAAGGGLLTDGASGDPNDAVGGTIRLCGCRFEGNTAVPRGGGAYLFAYHPDQVFVDQCTFAGNHAAAGGGSDFVGAGALEVGNAVLELSRSTFDANTTDGQGGALFLAGEHESVITNCTFHANRAADWGGAISGSNLVLRNVTLAGNQADQGIDAINAWDAVSLDNSILAAHRDDACSATFAGQRTLQWSTSGAGGAACVADVLRADPLLGSLGDYGGPTWTMPLGAGSPALGVGQDCPPVDQRGEPRPAACDLGAYEAP